MISSAALQHESDNNNNTVILDENKYDSDEESVKTVVELDQNMEDLDKEIEELNKETPSLEKDEWVDIEPTVEASPIRKSNKKSSKSDSRTEKLITNNERSIENLEREMIHRTELSESRFEKLERLVQSLQATIGENQAKYEKEVLATRSKFEKHLERCTGKLEEQQETIIKQKVEINDLKNKLSNHVDISHLHNKLSGEIKDLDIRVLNRLKEEREKEHQEAERTSKLIKDVQLAIQTKASQSDLDKIRNKTLQDDGNNAPRPKENTNKSNSNTFNTPNNNEENSDSPSRSNRHNDRDSNNPRKKVINAKIVLLMDSNRRYIDTERFGEITWKIRTAMAQDLQSVIERFDFSKVQHIVISTGTNDTDTRQVDDIFADLGRLKH